MIAYKFGETAAEAINTYGLIGAVVVVVALVVFFIVYRIVKKRVLENEM